MDISVTVCLCLCICMVTDLSTEDKATGRQILLGCLSVSQAGNLTFL